MQCHNLGPNPFLRERGMAGNTAPVIYSRLKTTLPAGTRAASLPSPCRPGAPPAPGSVRPEGARAACRACPGTLPRPRQACPGTQGLRDRSARLGRPARSGSQTLRRPHSTRRAGPPTWASTPTLPPPLQGPSLPAAAPLPLLRARAQPLHAPSAPPPRPPRPQAAPAAPPRSPRLRELAAGRTAPGRTAPGRTARSPLRPSPRRGPHSRRPLQPALFVGRPTPRGRGGAQGGGARQECHSREPAYLSERRAPGGRSLASHALPYRAGEDVDGGGDVISKRRPWAPSQNPGAGRSRRLFWARPQRGSSFCRCPAAPSCALSYLLICERERAPMSRGSGEPTTTWGGGGSCFRGTELRFGKMESSGVGRWGWVCDRTAALKAAQLGTRHWVRWKM